MKNFTNNYWHLCSDELPNDLIFRNDKEYVYGMNSFPLALQSVKIKIYCFTLMSNHLHILLSGEKKQAEIFFNKLKQHLGMLLPHSPLRGLKPKLIEVPDEEAFRTEVAYIMRNCLAAGICDPYNYKWGTGYLYFNPRIGWTRAVQAKEMSSTNLRNMINSRIHIPDFYLICDGIILPESYVHYHKVEELFGKPKDLFAMIRYWNLEQKEVFMTTGVDKEFYDDAKVLKKLRDDWGIDNLRKLDIVDRRKKVPMLRNMLGCSIKQICRIAALDEITVRRFSPW